MVSAGDVKKGLYVVLACLAFILTEGVVRAQETIQERFIYALYLIDDDRHDEGIELLEEIYESEPTPRMRLELARAYWLADRLNDARSLFKKALADNPPDVVRTNIVNFLNRIDKRQGRLKFNLVGGLYSNPLRQPGEYSFDFYGIPLTFEGNTDYKNIWGAEGSVSFSKESKSGLLTNASFSYRELEGSLADRSVGFVNLAGPQKPNALNFGLSLIRFGQQGQSFTLPRVSVGYVRPVSGTLALAPNISVGRYISDSGSGASGFEIGITSPLVFKPDPSSTILFGPSYTDHSVIFGELSYRNFSLKAIGQKIGREFDLNFSGSVGRTKFRSVDPFWGSKREDYQASASFSVTSNTLKLGGFRPNASISCDKAWSNIDFYEYDGCDIGLGLSASY